MPVTINELISMADAHVLADEYRAGHYEWRDGGACSVGCSCRDLGLQPKDHRGLAELLGIEPQVVYVADVIFERISAAEQRAWTPRWLRAARDGTQRTDIVWLPFASRLLGRARERTTNRSVISMIEKVIALCDERAASHDPRWEAVTQASWAAYVLQVWATARAATVAHAASWSARVASAAGEVEVRQQADDLCELLALPSGH